MAVNETVKVNPATESEVNWRTIIILIGIALGIFMGALESTVVGTAMPTVIASLGGIEVYSWVFAVYILATTIMTPIWGKMADLIGRRPAFFGGLAIFLLGSALSGAAHSMTQLIAFRALQGLGAGALFPVGMTIAADLLSLERRAKLVGLFSGMWGVASLFGPLAGGYLTDHLSWRWVFYINLPVGLASWAVVWIAYTERYERKKNITLDYPGALTLAGALTLLLYVVEKGAEQAAVITIATAAGCLALLAAFVVIELRSVEPLVPLDLFHNRMVTAATLHGLFAGMALLGVMAFLPLFVQAVIGTTATQAGGILTPFILTWTACSVLGSRASLRFGYRRVSLVGMALMLIGTGLLAQVSAQTGRPQLVIDVMFMGMGGGLTFVTLLIASQHAVERARLGVATSMIQFARTIGAVIGIGTMGALMTWQLNYALAHGGHELAGLATGHGDISAIVRQSTRAALSPAAAEALRQALAGSLRWAFLFALGATAAAAIASLFIPGGQAHELAHPEHSQQEPAASLPEL